MMNLAQHSDVAVPPESSLAERQGWVGLVFVVLIAFHFFNFLLALTGLGKLMASMMVAFVVLLALLPEQSRNWMRPLIVGNALVGLLIARALAENICIVFRYRRERA